MMAKGRFISRSIAIDKRLNALSIEAELLFLKTVPHLDRDGLILYGDGPELWAAACPRRPELLPKIEALVQEWIDCGLVVAYEDAAYGTILYFSGFGKNQAGMRYTREQPSLFAPPPGYVRTTDGLEIDAGGQTPSNSPHTCRTYSGPTPDKVRTDSGKSPAEDQDQDKDKDQDQSPSSIITEEAATEADASGDDDDYAELYRFYEQSIGRVITPHDVARVNQIKPRPDKLKAAIQRTADEIMAGKHIVSPMSYALAICQNQSLNQSLNNRRQPNGQQEQPSLIGLTPDPRERQYDGPQIDLSKYPRAGDILPNV